MAQREIELILTRQLASYLAMPIFLVDLEGTLIYFNEPAEAILGRRFEETGGVPMEGWANVFAPSDASGALLPLESLPLAIAVRDRRPAHGSFWVSGPDGSRRKISATAVPLVGQSDRDLGSLAIFWEEPGG